jgi:hypothetical protein
MAAFGMYHCGIPIYPCLRPRESSIAGKWASQPASHHAAAAAATHQVQEVQTADQDSPRRYTLDVLDDRLSPTGRCQRQQCPLRRAQPYHRRFCSLVPRRCSQPKQSQCAHPPKVTTSTGHAASGYESTRIQPFLHPPSEPSCWLGVMDHRRPMGELPARGILLVPCAIWRDGVTLRRTGRARCSAHLWHVLPTLQPALEHHPHGREEEDTQAWRVGRAQAEEESG